jgi:hypothetical protein
MVWLRAPDFYNDETLFVGVLFAEQIDSVALSTFNAP